MTPLPEFARAFPARPADLNKYSAGVVTVVGGSARYNHAPVISALGARVGGAGLVQLVVPDASRLAAAALVPEATFTKQTPTCVPPKADVTVVGMGLGITPNAEMLVSRILSGNAGRFVIDADALTILANWYAAMPDSPPMEEGQTRILTPHAGEAARLLACTSDEVNADREAAAHRLADRYRAVAVLKGQHTLVAAPDRNELWRCPAGNPFMALGGMGDLLGGLIAARWAALTRRGVGDGGTETAFLAAASAVWLHASASDAIVNADPPGDPSVAETAKRISSFRVQFERGR